MNDQNKAAEHTFGLDVSFPLTDDPKWSDVTVTIESSIGYADNAGAGFGQRDLSWSGLSKSELEHKSTKALAILRRFFPSREVLTNESPDEAFNPVTEEAKEFGLLYVTSYDETEAEEEERRQQHSCGVSIDVGPAHDRTRVTCMKYSHTDNLHYDEEFGDKHVGPFMEDVVLTWRGGGFAEGDPLPVHDIQTVYNGWAKQDEYFEWAEEML